MGSTELTKVVAFLRKQSRQELVFAEQELGRSVVTYCDNALRRNASIVAASHGLLVRMLWQGNHAGNQWNCECFTSTLVDGEPFAKHKNILWPSKGAVLCASRAA